MGKNDILLRQKERETRRKTMLASIMEKFLGGELSNLEPSWLSNKLEIKKSKDPGWKDVNLNRYQVFCDINIDILLNNLSKDFHSYFFPKQLFNPRFDQHRTSGIVDAWVRDIKLPPPLLKVNNRDELYIEDGKHRINAAYCLNQSKLPILMSWSDLLNTQNEYVLDLLGPS